MNRTGRALRLVAVVAALAAMGASILVTPVGAHTKKKNGSPVGLKHLISHITAALDPRYVNVGEKASDADKLDGIDSSGFLGAAAKAADADKLDGIDSSGFLGAAAKAADADKLDGIDSSGFLPVAGKAADANKLDGLDSSAFQSVCGPGAVYGFANIDADAAIGTSLGTTGVVPGEGFSCGGVIRVKREVAGSFEVWFGDTSETFGSESCGDGIFHATVKYPDAGFATTSWDTEPGVGFGQLRCTVRVLTWSRDDGTTAQDYDFYVTVTDPPTDPVSV